MTAGERLKLWKQDPIQFVVDNFKITPDEWQRDTLSLLGGAPNPRRRIAMKACTGPGKAQPIDMVIETPQGKRVWGDLKVGDEVFGLDGKATIITKVHERGDLELYKITFDDGSFTESCIEHLWRVRGRTERRHGKQRSDPSFSEKKAISQGHPRTPADGWAVLSLGEIIERNRSNDGLTRKQFEIPTQGEVEFPYSLQPLDPYVLGAWLGDGGRKTGRGSWRDKGIDEEILKRGYRLGRPPAPNTDKSVTVYGILSHLREIGVAELGSPFRYIPDTYKYASIEQRKSVLAGLLDTDGSIGTDGSVSFDVTSKRLVEDVCWLVRSLGGIAGRIREKAGSYRHVETREIIHCRVCYRVTITLPFNPFVLERKRIRWNKPQDRYLKRFIERIEPSRIAQSRCIEVSHPLRCYLANDFIVTHNSALLAWAGWHRLTCFAAKGEHPKGVAVSGEGKDNLSDNLWAELAKWQSRSEFLQDQFTWNKERITNNDYPETWFLSARSYAKDADAESIGRSLSGLHSQFPFVLLDETGDMPITVGQKASQAFTGGVVDGLIISAGNPTSTSGLLYNIVTIERDNWDVITITADPDDPKRTPRVDIEHAKKQIELYGRDNPWVMATILGEFPSQGFNSLLSVADVESAMKLHLKIDQYDFAQKRLGCDVARFGDDITVIFPRQGLAGFNPVEMRNAASNDVAARMAKAKADWGSELEFIDGTGGYGAGVIDSLRQAGIRSVEVQFAGRATDPRFFNKRTEIWWLMAEWVKKGGALPTVPGLVRQLTAPTYTFQNGKIRLEEKDQIKKRLGFSPDHADALAVTFALPDQPAKTQMPWELLGIPARGKMQFDGVPEELR